MRSVRMENGNRDSGRGAFAWGAAALAVVLCAGLLLVWALPVRADDDDDGGGGNGFVPRQVVVKLTPGANIGAVNRAYGTRTIEPFVRSSKIYLLRTRKGVNPESKAERMEADRRVIYAEPNLRTSAPEGDRHAFAGNPSDNPDTSEDAARYSTQYAVGALNLPAAHRSTEGRGSVVAVLDTGVQAGHPEFEGRLTRARYDFVDDDRGPGERRSGRDRDRDGVKDEMFGHGTHVAGIVHLAAPGARIMPIRVLDPEGRGNAFAVAEAILYASRNGADVVNLSLSAPRQSELLDELIEDAAEGEDDEIPRLPGGTVTVGAAGNLGTSARQYPAAGEDVLAVTAVNRNERKPRYANYGRWISLAAPGQSILSLYPGGRYASWQGTSMATPFVSGQAALLYSLNPRAEETEDVAECVANTITRTARPLAPALGAGHADANAAVNSLRRTGCAPGGGGGSEGESEGGGESEGDEDDGDD